MVLKGAASREKPAGRVKAVAFGKRFEALRLVVVYIYCSDQIS